MRCGKGAAAALAVALLVGAPSEAEAQSKRHRRSNPLRAALEPILAARAVIHAVAEPIVHAPAARFRAARSAARDEPIYDAIEADDELDEEAPRAVRVAYMAPRSPAAVPPRDVDSTRRADAP